MLVFDIETGPLPDEALQKLLPPFDESPYLVGEFDERSVKLGNMKDPAKIKAKIDAARDEHATKKANLEETMAMERDLHWMRFVADAALDAVTGRVICVSYCDAFTGEVTIVSNDLESEVISLFWKRFICCQRNSTPMAGLNINKFDLPFLVRRSWILGVKVPEIAFSWWKDRINWHELFVDVRVRWLLGEHQGERKSKFETLAAAFGTGGKPTGITGADFARLWHEDRDVAIDYATQDVVQPIVWLEKMGLLTKPKPKTKAKRSQQVAAETLYERVEF